MDSRIKQVQQQLEEQTSASTLLRTVWILGAGAALALALAAFMHGLIASSDMVLERMERVNMLDFVRLKRDEQVERKDRTPERPQLNEAPDVPEMDASDTDSGETLAVSDINVSHDIGIEGDNLGIGAGEGDYLPIVKVAPIYPRRALARGIEGDCAVRYTVTAQGTVKDPVVDERYCENAEIFGKPSIQAALRFKYKPRIINGEAIEVTGVYNMFHYSMAKD